MASTSRAIRTHAEERGKPIYAFVDEQACSAAYGLACAADEIWGPPTAEVGSIGVILPIVDVTEAQKKAGVKVDLLTTGKRKGDGHPSKPLDRDSRAALQARVDQIGADFFELVAESRDLEVDEIRSLQAGVFMGDDAVLAGLLDGVASWQEFFEMVEVSVSAEENAQVKAKSEDNEKKDLKAGGNMSQTDTRARARGDLTMGENLKSALVQAKKKAAAEVAKAGEIADPKKRAVAMKKAVAEFERVVEAASTYKKTVKVEKSDDGDGDEDKKEKSEDEESEDEAPESEEPESEDEAPESEEPESEDDEPEASTKRSSVLALVKRLTGTADPSRQKGALEGLVARATAYDKLAPKVEALAKKDRAAHVDSLIAKAIDEKKLFKGHKEHVAELRKMGMKDAARLESYLAAMPRHDFRSADEIEDEPEGESIANIKLSAAEEAIVQTIAMHTKKPADDIRAEFIKNKAKRA